MGEVEERLELIIKKLVAISNTLEKMNKNVERLTNSSARIERDVSDTALKSDDILKQVGEIGRETQELKRRIAKLGDMLLVKHDESTAQVIGVVKEETLEVRTELGSLKQSIQAMGDDIRDRIELLGKRLSEESGLIQEAFRRIENILTELSGDVSALSMATGKISNALTEIAASVVLSQLVASSRDSVSYGVYEYSGVPVFLVERRDYVKLYVFSFDKIPGMEDLARIAADATGKPVIPVYVTVTPVDEAKPAYVASNEEP